MNLTAYPAWKNRATNPYQALLYSEMERLGWRVWDFGPGIRRGVRPDIVHLHWPDGFAFHRSVIKTLLRTELLLRLIDLWRLRGAKVVWTVHNLRSHEGFHPRVEAPFWQRLYGRLDGIVALNRFTIEALQSVPQLRTLPSTVIRHGLYPRLVGEEESFAQSRGEKENDVRALDGGNKGPVRLLLFGKLRPYKELPLLVEAFAGLEEGTARLTIAGQCHDAGLAGFLEREQARLPNLRVEARFLVDAELDARIRACDAVVIPYAGSLNSGVAFLALAYGKPIITPATPGFCEIQEDFGPERVRLFDPPLDAGKLAECIALAALAGAAKFSHGGTERTEPMRAIQSPVPPAYTWPEIARQHGEFFAGL